MRLLFRLVRGELSLRWSEFKHRNDSGLGPGEVPYSFDERLTDAMVDWSRQHVVPVMHGDHLACRLMDRPRPTDHVTMSNIRLPDGSIPQAGDPMVCPCGEILYGWGAVRIVGGYAR